DHVFDRFFEHRVLDAFALTFNGQHALFTRDGGDLNDLVDVGPDIEIHLFEDGGKKFESAFDVVGRIRKQHRAGRAAKNDDSGRPLHDLADMPAFEHLSADHASHAEENTDD